MARCRYRAGSGFAFSLVERPFAFRFQPENQSSARGNSNDAKRNYWAILAQFSVVVVVVYMEPILNREELTLCSPRFPALKRPTR